MGVKNVGHIEHETKTLTLALLNSIRLEINACLHIIYNIFSYYTQYIIFFIKEKCSKIDIFSDQACHNCKMHHFYT